MQRQLKVCIVWHGLPAYAARLIRGVVCEPGIDLQVFATKSPEESKYLEEVIGQTVHWINGRNARELAKSIDADVCFVSGWAFAECNHFAQAARARGAPVVAMIDNRWRGDLRQRLGSIYFRLMLQRTIDFAWVPGQSAARLCRFLGIPDNAVTQGLYGGDGTVFAPSSPGSRPPRIGFVGQLIRRKGFDLLVSAFKQLHETVPEYELHVYGRGELESLAAGVQGIVLHPFAQTHVIAEAMRSFRIFVMPSRDDNWPLALHEAALSGCTLVTTLKVGSAAELVRESNGLVISRVNDSELAAALRTVAEWPTEKCIAASAMSRRLAEAYGPEPWLRSFRHICTQATGGRWTPK